MKDDYWDITNRPSTKMKLEILRGIFHVWLTIWNKQNWASNEWYVLDLFSGRGYYKDGELLVSGSPFVYLEKIKERRDKFIEKIKIKLFFVDIDKDEIEELQKNVENYVKNNQIDNIVEVIYFNEDCNEIINDVLKKIINSNRNPLFVFIDPTGIKIKKNTINEILNLENPKDIFLNYSLEGVRRTMGVARKAQEGEDLNVREVGTIETLGEFFGDDINIVDKDGLEIKDDLETLKYYVSKCFLCKNLEVVACDIVYPDRNDILYYLLFASRKPNIVNIIKDIYKREKHRDRPSLFGPEFYNILYFKR